MDTRPRFDRTTTKIVTASDGNEVISTSGTIDEMVSALFEDVLRSPGSKDDDEEKRVSEYTASDAAADSIDRMIEDEMDLFERALNKERVRLLKASMAKEMTVNGDTNTRGITTDDEDTSSDAAELSNYDEKENETHRRRRRRTTSMPSLILPVRFGDSILKRQRGILQERGERGVDRKARSFFPTSGRFSGHTRSLAHRRGRRRGKTRHRETKDASICLLRLASPTCPPLSSHHTPREQRQKSDAMTTRRDRTSSRSVTTSTAAAAAAAPITTTSTAVASSRVQDDIRIAVAAARRAQEQARFLANQLAAEQKARRTERRLARVQAEARRLETVSEGLVREQRRLEKELEASKLREKETSDRAARHEADAVRDLEAEASRRKTIERKLENEVRAREKAEAELALFTKRPPASPPASTSVRRDNDSRDAPSSTPAPPPSPTRTPAATKSASVARRDDLASRRLRRMTDDISQMLHDAETFERDFAETIAVSKHILETNETDLRENRTFLRSVRGAREEEKEEAYLPDSPSLLTDAAIAEIEATRRLLDTMDRLTSAAYENPLADPSLPPPPACASPVFEGSMERSPRSVRAHRCRPPLSSSRRRKRNGAHGRDDDSFDAEYASTTSSLATSMSTQSHLLRVSAYDRTGRRIDSVRNSRRGAFSEDGGY